MTQLQQQAHNVQQHCNMLTGLLPLQQDFFGCSTAAAAAAVTWCHAV
jgi:hypothetical protein